MLTSKVWIHYKALRLFMCMLTSRGIIEEPQWVKEKDFHLGACEGRISSSSKTKRNDKINHLETWVVHSIIIMMGMYKYVL